ncbi:MAG: hypothetical protein AAGI48_05305 [Verrucomicrobiota bacterium]
MKNRPNEKDWKAFRQLVPTLRERYLQVCNNELVAILADDERSPTEKFWGLEERVGEVAGTLRACLDGHSRSTMNDFMMRMLGAGMMTVEDLEPFGEELRERMVEWSKADS